MLKIKKKKTEITNLIGRTSFFRCTEDKKTKQTAFKTEESEGERLKCLKPDLNVMFF